MITESNKLGESQDASPFQPIASKDVQYLSYWFAGCAAITVIIAMVFLNPILSGNDASRWNTVWSLVNGHGYIIDDAPFYTVDKVNRDGHFYSSKPPLYATLVAGIAKAISAVTGVTFSSNEALIVRCLLVLFNVIPLSLMIIFYGLILSKQNLSRRTSLICLIVASWGTYVSSYSVSLNNHTPAAISCFFALYHLIAIVYWNRNEWWRFSLCGLFSSWAVCSELPAAAFGLVVFLWLVRHRPYTTITYFIAPAAAVFSAYFLTTWLATGGLVPNYVRFNSPLYLYEGSYWLNPRGIDAANDSKLFYLFNLTFGHHGIFSLSPFIFLSLIGCLTGKDARGVHRLGLLLICALLTLYLLKSNNYGGECQGPRWFLWLTPFWLISLGPFVEIRIRKLWPRIFIYLCVGISVVSAILAMSPPSGPWGASWLHTIMKIQGWTQY